MKCPSDQLWVLSGVTNAEVQPWCRSHPCHAWAGPCMVIDEETCRDLDRAQLHLTSPGPARMTAAMGACLSLGWS